MLDGSDGEASPARLAVALGIGLLIGLERERRKGEGPERNAAGIRTFALVGLLGGAVAAIGGTAALAVGGAFVGGAALVSYVYGKRSDPGLTTEVTLVLTYFLGVLAQTSPDLAAGVGVAATVLLAVRTPLHQFVRNAITEQEMRDLLLFVTAAVVLLPLLPDKTYGPEGALNPRSVWRVVVLVMGIGGAGYIAVRILKPRYGLPVAGLAGGFVSSAATIGSMGALSKDDRRLNRSAIAGAVLSNVATMIQMVVVLSNGSRDVMREMAIPLAAGALAAALVGLVVTRGAIREEAPSRPLRRAFDPRGALAFAAIVATMTLVSAMARDWFGDSGVLVAATLGGFADSHASAASVAALVGRGQLEAEAAVLPIAAAVTSNSITKLIAAYAAGGSPFARPVWAGIAGVLVAVWGGVAARSLFL